MIVGLYFLFSNFSPLLFYFLASSLRLKPTQGLIKLAGPMYLNEGESLITSTRLRIDGECVRMMIII
jgi:hypothetical protein